jgi:hypothetical protein|tara:strand:+ start:1398 stop:2195 length:798 start_codon:yes stop_codon:yes gene_type:complete
MGREPKLLVAVGKKGVGKSYTTKEMMQQYAYANPRRRVLILDVNDEYYDIKAIRIQDVSLFSVHPTIEIRRIRPFLDDGKRMTLDDIASTLFIILETFRNGLLLVEDINKYISDTMPNDLVGAICTNRHIGVDIIMHYQSIGRITSKVWQNLNIIRMHKITDSVKKHKHKFEDKYEYISIAELMINQEYERGNKHFFVYIDVDDERLYGSFTESQFENAVNTFIQNNYSNVISPMLNARNERGQKVHTAQSAIAEYKKRLYTYKK